MLYECCFASTLCQRYSIVVVRGPLCKYDLWELLYMYGFWVAMQVWFVRATLQVWSVGAALQIWFARATLYIWFARASLQVLSAGVALQVWSMGAALKLCFAEASMLELLCQSCYAGVALRNIPYFFELLLLLRTLHCEYFFVLFFYSSFTQLILTIKL